MKCRFLAGSVALVCFGGAGEAAAAAQDATSAPWASQKIILSNLPTQLAGPMVVSPSGEVFAALLSSSIVSATNKAGDSSGGSSLIAKVSGGKILFVLQLGGSYSVSSIAADADGNVYVSGVGTATGLPVTPGAYRLTSAGPGTPYVCKLNSSDGSPLFCTYLDNNVMRLAVSSMSVDLAGNIYITADRAGANINATPGALSVGDREVLVMKLDPTASKLIFAAEFGGSSSETPWSILADAAGNVYVAGSTTSTDFPGTLRSPLPPPSSTNLGFTTPFVAKLNASGTKIVYAVYGRADEETVNIAVDSAGEIHLLAAAFLSNPVRFVVRKYTSDGTGIVYETPFATEASWVNPLTISVDDQGVATVAGSTAAIGFPVRNATSPCSSPGDVNAYMVRLSPVGAILQSSFLASNGPAVAVAVSVQAGRGYIAASIGTAGSQQLGVLQIGADTTGSAGTALGCYGNAATFLGGPLAPGEVFSVFGNGLGPARAATIQWGSNQPVGASLGGVTVTFDGTPVPLLYVQSAQINAIAPWGITRKSEAELCVSYGGRQSCTKVPVAPAAPGIFQYAGPNDTMYAAAVNQDGTLNSPAHPARTGSIVSLYMTGLGALSPAPADGSIVQFPLPMLISQVQIGFTLVYCAGLCPTLLAGEVLYSGAAPFEVAGLYQINVRIPDQSTGALTLYVQTSNGTSYQTQAAIAIQ